MAENDSLNVHLILVEGCLIRFRGYVPATRAEVPPEDWDNRIDLSPEALAGLAALHREWGQEEVAEAVLREASRRS